MNTDTMINTNTTTDPTNVMIEEYIKTIYTMEKDEITSSVQIFINNLCNNLNNPSLIHINESPNANTIYHLYSNGQITWQKGGWAYGSRSEFIYKDCIFYNSTFFTFTNKINNDDKTYIICTFKTCEIIRTLMQRLLNYIDTDLK